MRNIPSINRLFSSKPFKKYREPTLDELAARINENNISPKYSEALEKFEGKILFNTVLEVSRVRLKQYEEISNRREERRKAYLQRQIQPLPLVLNQLCDGALDELEPKDEEEHVESKHAGDLPYSRYIKVENDDTGDPAEDRSPKNWLHDYELYDGSEEEIVSTYGTPDPNMAASDIPCTGCGSILHCKESSVPGYLPSELFKGLSKDQLKTLHCQRCHFLVNYNTAINVTVKPEDYIKIVSSIKDKFALAIVLVDLLDFPCSIFTGLSELLGSKRPIFLVGNKVDLIPMDQPDYLNHIKRCLKEEAIRLGFEDRFIKYVSLISAKTGYGIEELITQLQHVWKSKGDVYLIGCANTGKSSLFNALLGSDYCKVEATDLIQRATTCPWPGTTLKMLKFPILK